MFLQSMMESLYETKGADIRNGLNNTEMIEGMKTFKNLPSGTERTAG